MKVAFKKLSPLAQAPVQAREGDACFDIHATGFSWNGSVLVVATGIALELPSGYEAQVRCRSGLGSKGVFVTNGVGTVDAGYRGEIAVFLSSVAGNPPYMVPGSKEVKIGGITLKVGDRVAQLAIRPVPDVVFEEVAELSDSVRGSGGFGSTGMAAVASAEPKKEPYESIRSGIDAESARDSVSDPESGGDQAVGGGRTASKSRGNRGKSVQNPSATG